MKKPNRLLGSIAVFGLACLASFAASASKLYTSPIIDLAGGEYSPSVMHDALDNNKIKIWWCAENQSNLYEVISYQEIRADGSRTAPQIVLKANSTIPGAPAIAWEGHRACDPTVIRGSWTYHGVNYTYAMYYTTEQPSPPTAVDSARIGMAYSNDGINWVKRVEAAVINGGNVSPYYGTGASVAWSVSGGSAVRMLYLDVTNTGLTRHFYVEAPNGYDFGMPTQMSYNGLSFDGIAGINYYHPAVAIAPAVYQNGYYFYLAMVCETAGPANGHYGTGVCVYRTAGLTGLTSGTWQKVLDPAHVRKVENQPGFATDQWGGLVSLPKIGVYLACGDDAWPGTWGMCVTDGQQ